MEILEIDIVCFSIATKKRKYRMGNNILEKMSAAALAELRKKDSEKTKAVEELAKIEVLHFLYVLDSILSNWFDQECIEEGFIARVSIVIDEVKRSNIEAFTISMSSELDICAVVKSVVRFCIVGCFNKLQ